MIEFLSGLSDSLMKYSIEQSISSLPLFFAVLILSILFRLKHPKVIHFLWGLFFVRLFVPLNTILDSLHFDDPLKIDYTFTAIELPVIETQAAIPMTIPVGTELSLSFYLLAAWIIISLLLMSRLITVIFSLKKLKRTSSNIEENFINNVLSRWSKIFGINKPVQIFVSDRINSAFNYGFFCHSIFLPSRYLQFSSKELDLIIAHECAHIKRRDNIKLFALQLIKCLLFFNPLVWTAARQMNICREQICDLMVINRGRITPFIYGSVLLNALQKPDMRALNTGFSFYKSFIKIRLKTLTRGKEMKKSALVFIISLTLIISLFSWGWSEIPMPVDGPSGNTQKFTSPLKTGRVTSRFGMRMHPILKKKMEHKGIDIAAKKGTPVYAAANGMVYFAQTKDGYGKVIYMKHADGWISVYAQLSEIKVLKGSEVKQSQEIGLVGSSGLSTAPHLHFELRKDDEPVNPDEYIKFNLSK